MDRDVRLRAAAALVEFLRQSVTSRIRKVVCKRRFRRWATERFLTPSFIVRPILSSAAATEQRIAIGNCGYNFEALKAMVPEALASVSNSLTAVSIG